MRISTIQVFESGLRGIQNAQSSAARTQTEISAGKKLLTPADDPSGAVLALHIRQDMERTDRYLKNADVAERDLRQQEAQLASVEDVLYRLHELFVNAGDGALSAQERSVLATELEQRADELLGLFNTQQATGEFLFAGFQGEGAPFVTRPSGAVEYAGDTGQRFLQIATGIDVEVRDNGRGLFVDIPAANNTFQTVPGAANTGNADIDVGRIVDQAAYDAVFPDDIVVSFDQPLGPGSFSVYQRDRDTGSLSLLTSQAYVPGGAVQVAGVEFRMQGTPATGDEFVLQASNRQPLVTTIQRLVAGLRSGGDDTAGAAARATAVAEGLANLDLAESHVFVARANLGARLGLLDSVREGHAQAKLGNQELLSSIEDLDYDEAISRLSMQTFVLEAAQKTLAKVSGLSLFNYL